MGTGSFGRLGGARIAQLFTGLVPLALVAAVGCLGPKVRAPVPDEVATKVWVNARPGDDYHDADTDAVAGLAAVMQGAAAPPAGRPQNVLCVSGGGKYAAFTAGALVGWSASGTRPTFDVATGVSSGAPTAFLAFLGPKYDRALSSIFVSLRRSDLFRWRPVRGVLSGGALMTSAPLEELLERYIDDEVMADLCAAQADGRRLFIATSNVLTHRLVVWDLGGIASSGRPDAKEIVRKVVLAACSIPGIVPAVKFDVTVNGVRYQELHADAGNLAQVFVRTNGPLAPGSNVWVLSAGKTHQNRSRQNPGTFETLVNAVSTALYALFRADTVKLHALCRVTNSRFGLIALPDNFEGRSSSMVFDPEESKRMYMVGYQMGAGGAWELLPPDTAPGQTNPPRAGLEFTTQP
ncbi:patatin-like phospholipase family protein [Gemmata sp. JC673]|uniref:Patatin-like phospholipase family protein n=1 Tax=Gemmata algarum TaxID=2975278 RepID=A0ABU5F499_9BACT|nr:patatin-like phospholipase family protein [Gemmata algarum]MDY3561013.1 patatin-like phospholipase family protein [Gemmata algarum]